LKSANALKAFQKERELISLFKSRLGAHFFFQKFISQKAKRNQNVVRGFRIILNNRNKGNNQLHDILTGFENSNKIQKLHEFYRILKMNKILKGQLNKLSLISDGITNLYGGLNRLVYLSF